MLDYELLPVEENWIRVITLHPALKEDEDREICCTLRKVRLEDASYEAISYVWGDPRQRRQIQCNDRPVNITVSLCGALRKLQPSPGSNTRTLWADAICINQSDVAERNSQVSKMGSIYARASSVHIWLGPDPGGNARPAFQLFEEINAYHEDGYRSDEEATWFEWSTPSPDQHFFDPSAWKHLQVLSQLPWFTRLWVLQEVGLAQTTLLHWGDESTKFSNMIECFSYIEKNLYFIPLRNTFGAKFAFILDAWWYIWITYCDKELSWKNECKYIQWNANHPGLQRRKDIFNVLLIGVQFKASVPHDYLYAHLGHPAARQRDGKGFVEVDYSRDVIDIYLDVAKQLLDGYHGLLLLSAVEHTDQILNEPSWVPQWHKITDIGILAPVPGFSRWYNASLADATKEENQMDITGQHLRVRGILFDIVDTCSARFTHVKESMSEHPVKAAVELCESPSRAIDAANTVDAISLVLVAGMYGVSATAAEDNLNDHRASFFAYCAAEKLDHVTRMEFLGNRIPSGMGSGSRDEYKKNVEDYTHHRRLFRTASGCFGLGPSATQPSDICCILYGSCMPFIIRRCGEGAYNLVGESYIHGVMRGEVVSDALKHQHEYLVEIISLI